MIRGLIFAIRIAGAIFAATCFFTGVWFVFTQLAQGLMLMGLGIVAGIAFGRVPAGSGEPNTGKK